MYGTRTLRVKIRPHMSPAALGWNIALGSGWRESLISKTRKCWAHSESIGTSAGRLAIRQLIYLFEVVSFVSFLSPCILLSLDSARLLSEKFYRLKNDWRCFPFCLNKIKNPQLNFHPPTPLCCRLTKANQDTPNVPASPSRSSQPIQVADASKCLVNVMWRTQPLKKCCNKKHMFLKTRLRRKLHNLQDYMVLNTQIATVIPLSKFSETWSPSQNAASPRAGRSKALPSCRVTLIQRTSSHGESFGRWAAHFPR